MTRADDVLQSDLPDLRAHARQRWLIACMLFVASMFNYIDRSILGIVAPTVQKELGVSDFAYARVADAFLIAYTLAYLFSGRLIDRFGARISMAAFVAFWSVANTLTAGAWSVLSLVACRFGLGLGEAGGYMASPKAVADWFTKRERGLAVGMYSLGGSVGATVAPLLVAGLSPQFGWRGVFIVTGVVGLLWVPLWLWMTRSMRPIADASDVAAASDTTPARWLDVARQPVVWRLALARLLTDSVWYFYLIWLPKYFASTWHVTQDRMGLMVYIFLAADVGFIGGGLLSGWLTRRWPAAFSRFCVMAAAAAMMPLLATVPAASSLTMVVVLTAIVALALCAWLGNITTLVVDTVPASRLATTFGIIAAGSAAGGVGINALVTATIQHQSYNAVFYAMAVLHPVALLIVWPIALSARVTASAPVSDIGSA